jgi:GntR family transcriptional regulator/MocR family aminotransferase
VAEPDQITVVQGSAQGIDLLLRVLRASGRLRIAVEDPSHATQHERVRWYRLTLVGQPVDGDGMVVDGLSADAVLTTPAHQFPTGVVLSEERRQALLQWADSSDRLIVEDDYDAEFRYDQEPVRALQGLAPNKVVQLGTVSKTLAPALRLGWLVAPTALADEFQRQKRLVDDFTPALDQLALAEFIRTGDYDRHVRRARKTYRTRRDVLVEQLAKLLPELPVSGAAAGVHVVLRLPDGADDARIAGSLRDVGISVPPLSAFAVADASQPGLVIGYGRLHESATEGAVRVLAEAVRRALD